MRILFGSVCNCGNDEDVGILVECNCGRVICYMCAEYDKTNNIVCPACGQVQDFDRLNREAEEQWKQVRQGGGRQTS